MADSSSQSSEPRIGTVEAEQDLEVLVAAIPRAMPIMIARFPAVFGTFMMKAVQGLELEEGQRLRQKSRETGADRRAAKENDEGRDEQDRRFKVLGPERPEGGGGDVERQEGERSSSRGAGGRRGRSTRRGSPARCSRRTRDIWAGGPGRRGGRRSAATRTAGGIRRAVARPARR